MKTSEVLLLLTAAAKRIKRIQRMRRWERKCARRGERVLEQEILRLRALLPEDQRYPIHDAEPRNASSRDA